jgi:hypothetical protein
VVRAVRRPEPFDLSVGSVRRNPQQWLVGTVVVLWTALVGLLAVGGDQPWLPREVVRLSDQSVRIGYVLATGDDVVILQASDNHVVHLPGPAKRRVICRNAGQSTQRSLVARLGWERGAPYPVCDKSLV